MNQDSPVDNQPSKKKWVIIGVVAGAALLIGAIIIVILQLTQPKESTVQKPGGPDEFILKPEGAPFSYAGSKVYDACNLVSFDTVRAHVKNYQTLLDTVGSEQRPAEPLVIKHNYVDRDIASVLGKDGEPRAKGTIAGGSGDEGISQFLSAFDSNCWYNQGEITSLGQGTTFVKVYIMQKPTPIVGELLAYINSLTPRQVEKGISLYTESKRDSANFATIIAVNEAKDTVVVFKTGSNEIADSAVADMIKALSETPRGPLSVTYPEPWTSLSNPCELINAADFQQYTGKSASALADDAIFLTDVGDGQMKRSCTRLEVERLNGGEVSESNVTVRVAKNAEEAKKYVAGLTANEEDTMTVQPLSQGIEGADEAYVRIEEAGQKRYELEMRAGEVFVAVNITTEAGPDSSVEAYIARMAPVAKDVLARLKK